jgi:hypothetical protein
MKHDGGDPGCAYLCHAVILRTILRFYLVPPPRVSFDFSRFGDEQVSTG